MGKIGRCIVMNRLNAVRNDLVDYSGLLASEFSQMFQMLDNELGPESTQFAFDQFRQNPEEKTVVGKSSLIARDRDKTKIDSFEVLATHFMFSLDIFKQNFPNSIGTR